MVGRRAWPADRQESKRAEPGVATPLLGEVRILQTDIQPRTENDMTTQKKIARRKLSLLELAAELRNVSKIYRLGEEEIRALDDVSLDIEAGEFISIIGPSGITGSVSFRSTARLYSISVTEMSDPAGM